MSTFTDKMRATMRRTFIRKSVIDKLIDRVFSAAPAYLRAHSGRIVLPPYTLAIFDDPLTPPTPPAPPTPPVPPADPPTPPPPADPPPRRRDGDPELTQAERDRERDREIAELKAHNKRINDENAERRRESREVKGENDVLRNRAIRDDVRAALVEAGAISDRITDLYLADQTDAEGKSKITLDKKTGRTVGLETLAEWKKNNPTFFTPEFDKDGFNKDGFTKDGFGKDGFNKDGFDKDGFDKEGFTKDGKDKDGKPKFDKDGFDKNGFDKNGKDKYGREKPAGRAVNNGQRPNRTSAGAANGAGAGTESDDGGRQGLPDLSKCKDAAERAQVMRDWKRSLRGSSTGFGKASSRH